MSDRAHCEPHVFDARSHALNSLRVRAGLAQRALLRRAEAGLLAAGHRRIWLQASRAGQPFYRAQGFEAVDEYPWKSRGGLR